jgi:two-component system, chemotaxis family, protein-glutamate methylesterase/glutaminase
MNAAIQRDVTGLNAPLVRVAIVDDSVVVRGLLTRWLSETPGVEVAGAFRSGREIIDALPALNPRIVLLDLDMPDMDGLTALPLILSKNPSARVIVVSSLSVHGADLTIKSLMRGATDYLPKPSNHREVSTSNDFKQALIAKVLAVGAVRARPMPPQPQRPPMPAPLARQNMDARAPAIPAAATPGALAFRARPVIAERSPGTPRALSRIRPKLIVIGASTGGPQALVAMLGAMRAAIPRVPIVIAQHMPPVFGSIFAGHLKQHAGLPVREVVDGLTLQAGTIYLAPGGCHSVIRKKPDGQITLALLPSEARGPWRPSIDLLFSSAAEIFGGDSLAIALTGMGRDGAEGAAHLASRGANILVQDEASSVVWGIPGTIAEAGFASAQLSPEKLGDLAASLIDGHLP